MEFVSLTFGLAWDQSLFFPYDLSVLWWKYVSYLCPTIVFLKNITYLVSRVQRWRGIFPQDELDIMSHLYLAQMRLWISTFFFLRYCFWLCWVFLVGQGLYLVAVCGLSSYGSPALEYRLYSCGPQALLLRGMWDLPRSGIEPVPPALAGRFFTSGSLENLPAPYFQPSCIIWEIPWGREWLPTAVFLSGELQGQRSLAGPSS